jgi:NADPH-dependent curcumin reductase CurA
MSTFRAWSLVKHPVGTPALECFELRTFPLPTLSEGEVLVENSWLSVEPSGRARMDAGRLPVGGFVLGEPMFGRALGRVAKSRADNVKVGDIVGHALGWRDRAVVPASALMPIPKIDVPVQAFLGVLGYTGLVGYYGIVQVAGVKQGDIVFVSGAAGAVGSSAVQFARLNGAGHIIGSAGGVEKCAWLKSIGCHATIDYRAEKDLSATLRNAAPEGIDVYFDNVGGAHLAAALDNARDHARFAECGMIGGYNSGDTAAPAQMFQLISKRVRMEGFGGPDIMDRIQAYQREAIPLVASGALQSRETVFQGLEATPQAFLGLFSGANMGKMLVRL